MDDDQDFQNFMVQFVLSLPIDSTIGFNPMARNWNSSKPLRLIGEKQIVNHSDEVMFLKNIKSKEANIKTY